MIKDVAGEELSNVAEIYEAVIKKGMEVIKWIVEYKKTLDANNLTKSLMEYSNQTPFIFQGTVSDLSFFWNHKELSAKDLLALNENTQQQLFSVLKSAQEKGLLQYDNTTETFTMTQKGYEYIYTPNYIESVVVKNQSMHSSIVDGINEELKNREVKNNTQNHSGNKINFDDGVVTGENEIIHETNIDKVSQDSEAVFLKQNKKTEKINPLSDEAIARRKHFSKLANEPLGNSQTVNQSIKTVSKGAEQSVKAVGKGAETVAKSTVATTTAVASVGISVAVEVGKEVLNTFTKPIKNNLHIK